MWIFSFLLPTFLFFRQNKLNFHRLFSLEVGPLKCYAILVIHISLDTRRNNAVMKSQNNASISYAATPRPAEFARLFTLPIDRIISNASAPREFFDEESLARLADSISKHGILQPVTVRRVKTAAPRSATDGTKVSGTVSEVAFLCGVSKFELVCGERRLRAAKMLGLSEIPCILMASDDEKSAEIAIVENIHREDLNFFEQAAAIACLIDLFQLTQEEAASRLSLSQPYLANKLRLLRLTPVERELILAKRLSERHARALLKLSTPEERINAVKFIVSHDLNVVQTEKYIDHLLFAETHADPAPNGRHLLILKDLRIFYNTLDRAISTMKRSGVEIIQEKRENDDSYELLIKIPKKYTQNSAV